jgi:hypothetical protein
MAENTLNPEEIIEVGFEKSEPNAGRLVMLIFIMVGVIVGSCYAVYYWYVGQVEYTRRVEVEIPIWQETKDIRAAETERLTQYKYIDKAKGTVQLPIERSMQLLIEEANAGKTFYGGANAPVKPYEEDPNLQQVLDKALGKTPAAAPAPAANDGNTPAGGADKVIKQQQGSPAAPATPAAAPASKH